ncbi:glycosyltransferase family 2 protein [Pseudotenacibaculum sp. MALMAid0570]|uniref:glycosyltransferase family 2 protein n=1 Tax=Pseudotenacibaculum sp. MALMAid0570 TaxID=3143938 RepID=UPI0032DF60E2
MIDSANITASIVLYKQDQKELLEAIKSFKESNVTGKLFLIDNSPTNQIKNIIKDKSTEYLFNHKNYGFGAGHNQILEKISDSQYHLILNPDVSFGPEVIGKLITELSKDEDLSMIAPKVFYQDGRLQYNARRYPSLLGLALRFLKVSNKYTKRKEYRNINLNVPFIPDFIQGSFLLFKTKDLLSLKGFDQRYFLYMEDVDICKKIEKSGKKKMYYPHVHIHHTLKKGSSKNFRLFLIHIKSIFKYFLKWGF